MLLNTTYEMGPLFRYSTAVAEGENDITEYFKMEATLDYVLGRDAYDKVWKALIPPCLKRRTAALRQYLAERTA